jgi:hypothetical protein
MLKVPTFTAQIYVGLKHRPTGVVYGLDVARNVIQQYVDEFPLCVTLTPTEYIYVKGSEPGFVVGLINYPRFPSTPERITAHAMELGKRLRKACRQFKVSIVFPEKTVMLGSSK